MKGPLQTLDNVEKAVPLPDGALSRDGWFFHDDSKSPILKDGWIQQRQSLPNTTSETTWYEMTYRQDWYFFGYGQDYQKGLNALMAVSGKVPLPRRYVLGNWFSRWFRYTSEDFRNLVQEFNNHEIPLDVLVMDMDWHRMDATSGFGHDGLTLGWTGYSWNRDLLPDIEELLGEFHAANLKIALNDHPHDGLRDHEDHYPEFMKELGKEANGENLPFNCGDREYWEAFWKHSHKPHDAIGADAWWLDWQQDKVMPNIPGLDI